MRLLSYHRGKPFWLRFFAYFTGIFLIALPLWTQKFFGQVSLDQTLSTLSFGMHGVLSADSVFLKRFIKWCLIAPFVLALALSFVRPIRFLRISLITVGLVYCFYQFQIMHFLFSLYQPEEDYFKTHYIDPAEMTFSSAHPKSLILIYVESLENNYSNKTLFQHDLLNKIDKQPDSTAFEHYTQMPGTGWTIGGIISTQCGVPLKDITIFNGNRLGENANYILPKAQCLSDILHAAGYRTIFMKGADLIFGGTNNFLASHHFDETYGRKEWLAKGIPEVSMNSWGLRDNDLFNQAKIKLNSLMKSKQPFDLTLLTVEMHGPQGQLSPYCKQQGFQKFTGIVECTSAQIDDFIKYVKQQGWLNRVNIVVLGDHLSMPNPVLEKLMSVKRRFIFNTFITQQPLYKLTDTITHFDMLPTLLTSLGFHFSGNRLGIGYTAIALTKQNKDKIPAPPADRINEMKTAIIYSSKRYNELWYQKSL
jgi:phosphoglycerol transferase